MSDTQYSWDAEYDVVVLGSGASGQSCAVYAARHGLSVALLEKMPQLGGSSAFAEGHAAFESDEQEKRGITVTKDEAFRTYLDYSHWRAEPALVSRFVENAAETIRRMREDIGAEYEEVTITAPEQSGELVTWHLPKGEVAQLLLLLEADARRHGVDIFTETPAKEILTEDGKVIGVRACDADGEEVMLGAKAVVVGTGGYASNPEMFNKFYKHPIGEKLIVVGSPGNTGDGITMVLQAGGSLSPSIGTSLLFPFMRNKTVTSHTNNAGMQPYFWVNSEGYRFTDETVGLNFGFAGDVVAALPGSFYWMVLDSATIDHLVNNGNEVGLGIYVRNYEKLVNLPTEIAADAENSENVVSADTIAELAQKMGVDPDILAGEVKDYNEACHSGVDSKFHKNAKYLHAVETGPFYAIKMETGAMITMGALRIDDKMRALNDSGEPVRGLYVVGCDAGGMYGEAYALTVPGTANGFALTSGWLSADDINARIHAGEL
ncbi:FAD-dependent oxidoreductase [Trueperella sp. LYQ143]|uniref:FAD-dependent oxidoreductase n=1 Tax=Trueperella sp. LYQ143 TaxID=3391059 RepID=UPI003983AFAB